MKNKMAPDGHQGLADAFGVRYDSLCVRYHDFKNHNNELGVIRLLIQLSERQY
jgi:hypothetical protein